MRRKTLAHIVKTDAFHWCQSGDELKSDIAGGAASGAADPVVERWRDNASAGTSDGCGFDDGVTDTNNDDGNKMGPPRGSPELDLLNVFDKLATAGEFDGVPVESPTESEVQDEVNDGPADVSGARFSAVLPSRFLGYLQAIWGRHSVVPLRNRSLRLGMACRGCGDTIIQFGWHVRRLRQRESSSLGKVSDLCITVMT